MSNQGVTSRGPALALVTGLAIHGLAVARALASRGVEVHAFADRERWRSPTTYTRHARIHIRDSLNTDALISHLQKFADAHPGKPIVLFPTSDRMAATIARNWEALRDRYVLSWAHCRDLVLRLQSKDNLAAFAERTGLLYPRSSTVSSHAECAEALSVLCMPLIVKPVRPLSSFKAIIVSDLAGMQALVARYGGDLPFVVQEFVPGGEGTLHACTVYLDHGRELCIMTSRKIAASPPGLGQGTVFVTEDNAETRELSRRFLAGLDLSGPVAVEFKRDPDGRYWLIEPNVGRTEYCVDLAIQSGINLPYIEYCSALGLPVPADSTSEKGPSIWFDTDKDPLCYLRTSSQLRTDHAQAARAVFPFIGHQDPVPVLISTVQQLVGAARSGLGSLLGR